MAAFSARIPFDLHGLRLENREVEKDHRNGDQGGQDAPHNLYFLLVLFIEQHIGIILKKVLGAQCSVFSFRIC